MKRISMLLVILLSASLAFSQTAEEILNRSSEAMGGSKVGDSIKSMIVQATNELPQNMMAKMTIYQKGKNVYAEMKVNANGMDMTVKQGCDGERCYSSDPYMGTREMTGEEKDQLLMQLDMASSADWRKLYSGGELVGEEQVEGKDAYKLKLTTLADLPVTAWFDKATHLLVRQDMKVKSPMGEMETQIYFKDYREVEGGLKIPFQTVTNVMQMELKSTITNVEVNVDIPDDKFKFPEGL